MLSWPNALEYALAAVKGFFEVALGLFGCQLVHSYKPRFAWIWHRCVGAWPEAWASNLGRSFIDEGTEHALMRRASHAGDMRRMRVWLKDLGRTYVVTLYSRALRPTKQVKALTVSLDDHDKGVGAICATGLPVLRGIRMYGWPDKSTDTL